MMDWKRIYKTYIYIFRQVTQNRVLNSLSSAEDLASYLIIVYLKVYLIAIIILIENYTTLIALRI